MLGIPATDPAVNNNLEDAFTSSLVEHLASGRVSAETAAKKEAVRRAFDTMLDELDSRVGKDSFLSVERWLFASLMTIGALALEWFLARWSEALQVPAKWQYRSARFERQRKKARTIKTLFNEVTYERDYLRRLSGRKKKGGRRRVGKGGFFPLDHQLGLTADGFSLPVLSLGTQLATKMSYSASRDVMKEFLGWAPSTKTLEKAVLGFGKYAEEFAIEHSPLPEGDGDTLGVQFDGKGHPTVRDDEMKKRRGKRDPKAKEARKRSPRHYGRTRRHRQGPKKRRKPGDKSKNAKVVHVIVLYTLKSEGDRLLGPRNKEVFVYTGSKRGAVRRARRLADRRGFTKESGKRIQVLTDGDTTYADEIKKRFPNAIHTLDIQHATEYIWRIARLAYPRATAKQATWAEERRSELIDDHDALFRELDARIDALQAGETTPSTGEADTAQDSASTKDAGADSNEDDGSSEVDTKSPLEQMRSHVRYLRARRHMMNYQELDEADLDWATGIVEGACRYVVGQRFDEGGMRWLKERAAPLLHLRTIELNGWWQHFIEHVHALLSRQARQALGSFRLLTQQAPTPIAEEAA